MNLQLYFSEINWLYSTDTKYVIAVIYIAFILLLYLISGFDNIIHKCTPKKKRRRESMILYDQKYMEIDHKKKYFDPISERVFEKPEDVQSWKKFIGNRTITYSEARQLLDEQYIEMDPRKFHPVALLRLKREIINLKNENSLNSITMSNGRETIIDIKSEKDLFKNYDNAGEWKCERCTFTNHTSKEGITCRACGCKKPRPKIPPWKAEYLKRELTEGKLEDSLSKNLENYNFKLWLKNIFPNIEKPQESSTDYNAFMKWSDGRDFTVYELVTLDFNVLKKWNNADPIDYPLHSLTLPILKEHLHEKRKHWIERVKDNDFLDVKVFPDVVPQVRLKYFTDEITKKNYSAVITVVVPFYNEERSALERTLKSLAKAQKYMQKQRDNIEDLEILLVMDGWFKAHETTKEYIKEMFGGVKVYEYLDQLKNFDAINMIPATTIIMKKRGKQKVKISEENKNDVPNYLNLTILLKADNRKKFNSHAWFFNAFSNEMDAKYAFATDCGTYYKKDMLHKLFNYMESHSKCVAVTGRQRVMSYEKQEAFFIKTETERRNRFPEKNIKIPRESWASKCYRHAQGFDYEVSLSIFNNAFAQCGCMSVIPGPCGFFRFEKQILYDSLKEYFDLMNRDPNETSLTESVLKLAEDRILSATAVISEENQKLGLYTTWLNSAIFYFEAETDSELLIKQRRRWSNGSFAGYKWLYKKLHWFGKNQFLKKIMVLCQLAMFYIAMISPAIFLATLNTTLSYWMNKETMFIGYLFEGIYVIVYLSFAWVHTKESAEFNKPLYIMYTFNNIILMILVMITFVWDVYSSIRLTGTINVIHVGIITMTLLPWLLGLLHSLPNFKVFYKMILWSTAFYLYLPTLVSTFFLYAKVREFDVSWGNRPDSENNNSGLTQEQRKKFKEKIRKDSNAESAKLISVNIFLMLLALAINTSIKSQIQIIIITIILFLSPLIQMTFSFCYYFYRIIFCQ